jgi:hypothetical protein
MRGSRKRFFVGALVGLVVLGGGFLGIGASAGTLTLQLTEVNLVNVEDGAGIWQYEGGTVARNGQQIGYYAATRRTIDGGTTPLNTAMLTLTIFYGTSGTAPSATAPSGTAPQNITIQGAHDYSSGAYLGGVSAASVANVALKGATVSGSTSTGLLTLTW